MLIIHIPKQELSAYYEAGWTVITTSETPGYLVLTWKNKRTPVIPFVSVADVMDWRETFRLGKHHGGIEGKPGHHPVRIEHLGGSPGQGHALNGEATPNYHGA